MKKKKCKTFRLKEANALLPEIEKRLKRLQKKKEAYARVHDQLFVHELVSAAERLNGLAENDDLEARIAGLEQAIEDLAKDVEAILEMGAILRDLERGRIDFLADLEGKPVFWSWELGEPSIGFYHHTNRNPRERIPIPARILKAP
ncbi:MAG TPA: DUF2203 family protein [Candidatus Omnitrophota bacterium]|jgi:hypothetical protein|nr:MAG: hypothetical protein BWY49_00818 [Candidatus Omnitrophica bacterium ADurb.Bin314]HOE69077.1 DUF2203 family protein [Candidatus Omnitrophota bacterium]HPW64732.1 DUF2203 family protein [Candidatus Omnitrophota bacterium]HQB94120.1 DUF2203 family protein [Candidatus Omnitrophota bacterium]